MTELVGGVVLFTSLVLSLVVLILAARWWLVPRGQVTVTVNGKRSLSVPVWTQLSAALSEAGIHMPAACGGRGTCGECRLTVVAGGGAALPVEEALLDAHERGHGVRLACQLTVREPLAIEIPSDILGVRRWPCRVASNRNVATLMRELILELPESPDGESLDFRAGAYVSLTCPPHDTPFSSLAIEPPYDAEWERLGLRRLVAHCAQRETRAYSIASPPADASRGGAGRPGELRLLVRIATPPPGAGPSVPPGAVSSWVFSLQPGDPVEVAGPYGNFRASETEREMIFVGGGAGMAPLRSIILDQLQRLHATRTISYWYGARNLRELLYREEFDELAAAHENFRWCAALSEPRPEDEWSGETGFIHAVLLQRYLDAHPAPEECEYYLCGPPLMVQAVLRMLDGLGVERDMIRFDDFGN